MPIKYETWSRFLIGVLALSMIMWTLKLVSLAGRVEALEGRIDVSDRSIEFILNNADFPEGDKWPPKTPPP